MKFKELIQNDKYFPNIWTFNLKEFKNCLFEMYAYLPKSEKEIANRFRFPINQYQYVLCRGLLRKTLSNFLEINPQTIIFNYNEYGKPFLDPTLGSKIEFNLSHSGDMMILAISENGRIGIDIERVRTSPEFIEIARQFFSNAEYLQLSQFDSVKQSEWFLKLWTIREAFVKCIGVGLQFPLEKINLQDLFEEKKLNTFVVNEDIKDSWTFLHLNLGNDYVATVVPEDPQWKPKWFSNYSIKRSQING